MTKYARIENSVVAELLETDGDISSMFHPDFVWVDAGPDVREGDTYIGGEFSRPAPPELQAPNSITMRQCRLMLHSEGLLVGVQAAIDALDEPAKTSAQIEWDYAQTVNRDNPVMQMLAAAMELDEGQLDQMFTSASQL
ncbi:hypothetical protein ACMHYO_14400 [Allopusillimonas ginsengisoli]|uniref:hypothetical protein n=1 Tax=Allopusillimonas ginsengisoli TaxID=453575 RepID=UPI0039C3E887